MAGAPVSVVNVDPAVAPSIVGVKAGQGTTSEAPLAPFSSITVSDANAGATDTLTIALSGGGGTLTGRGLTYSHGVYILSGTAGSITSALDALVFTPTKGAANSQQTTTFTLTQTSTASATAAVNATTTVTNTDPAAGTKVVQSATPAVTTTPAVSTMAAVPTSTVTTSPVILTIPSPTSLSALSTLVLVPSAPSSSLLPVSTIQSWSTATGGVQASSGSAKGVQVALKTESDGGAPSGDGWGEVVADLVAPSDDPGAIAVNALASAAPRDLLSPKTVIQAITSGNITLDPADELASLIDAADGAQPGAATWVFNEADGVLTLSRGSERPGSVRIPLDAASHRAAGRILEATADGGSSDHSDGSVEVSPWFLAKALGRLRTRFLA